MYEENPDQVSLTALVEVPDQIKRYPKLRFMGSKSRLLPWIHKVFASLDFATALDAFSGAGAVSYLLKAMGKEVATNDFLGFAAVVAKALIENSHTVLTPAEARLLLEHDERSPTFIRDTFEGIFYTPADLRALDGISWKITQLDDPYKRAVAMAGLIRSCVKRQPRGVFTVAGDPEHYKDGRRDLRLAIADHFLEQVDVYNNAVFDNGQKSVALQNDIFELDAINFDLVYLDPPYVPRADDNCYIKRYHFLEGLSCYWHGLEIMAESRVKKLIKPYTPFSYRSEAEVAFGELFSKFERSILVLSYSSNGFPDLDTLCGILRQVKRRVDVHRRQHRYHFGTHGNARRTSVEEYLIVGTD